MAFRKSSFAGTLVCASGPHDKLYRILLYFSHDVTGQFAFSKTSQDTEIVDHLSRRLINVAYSLGYDRNMWNVHTSKTS